MTKFERANILYKRFNDLYLTADISRISTKRIHNTISTEIEQDRNGNGIRLEIYKKNNRISLRIIVYRAGFPYMYQYSNLRGEPETEECFLDTFYDETSYMVFYSAFNEVENALKSKFHFKSESIA